MTDDIVRLAYLRLTQKTLDYVDAILGSEARQRAVIDTDHGTATFDGLVVVAANENYPYLRIVRYKGIDTRERYYTFSTIHGLAIELNDMYKDVERKKAIDAYVTKRYGAPEEDDLEP